MRAYAGSMITCDVAVKQMILAIDERMPCIVMDLDETHVLVNTSMVDTLLIQLETEFEKNTYTLDM